MFTNKIAASKINKIKFLAHRLFSFDDIGNGRFIPNNKKKLCDEF